MLKGLDPLLTGDLLKVLADMGHGDDLVIADANFPAASMGARVIEMPGVSATDALRAVLVLFPVDDFVDEPAVAMAAPGERPAIYAEFEAALEAAEGRAVRIATVDRFGFYDRARAAFAVVLTGERRLYGNVCLTKGVVRG